MQLKQAYSTPRVAPTPNPALAFTADELLGSVWQPAGRGPEERYLVRSVRLRPSRAGSRLLGLTLVRGDLPVLGERPDFCVTPDEYLGRVDVCARLVDQGDGHGSRLWLPDYDLRAARMEALCL